MSSDALRGHFERDWSRPFDDSQPALTDGEDFPPADPPYDRQREEHARDLLRAWADAASDAGCPPSFVARMRTFADMHDRHAAEAAP